VRKKKWPTNTGSNFKQKNSRLKNSITRSGTSHLDACNSIEFGHPYMRRVLQMLLTHWVKFKPKFYAQILHQFIVSSLGQGLHTGSMWLQAQNAVKGRTRFLVGKLVSCSTPLLGISKTYARIVIQVLLMWTEDAFPVWCLYLSPFQAAFPSQYCIPLSSWGYETS
jgi:hypothetical protein